jgi:hypothetical protein
MSNKEEEVQRAKLAEQAERYDNILCFIWVFFHIGKYLDMTIWRMP